MPPSAPEHEQGGVSDERPDLLAGQHFPPPPKQERSRQKRDAILRSALALFAERGYEETSIGDIARHAGVAVGAFYQHFTSKRQILLVLMDRLLQEAATLTLEAESSALHDIRDALSRLVRRALQVDWSYAGAYRAWREAAVRDKDLRIHQQRIEAWTAHQLLHLFQFLLFIPGARQGVDSETLAWEMALLLLRLAEVPLEDPDAAVASLTSLIYHSLFTDGEESFLEREG